MRRFPQETNNKAAWQLAARETNDEEMGEPQKPKPQKAKKQKKEEATPGHPKTLTPVEEQHKVLLN